jgi:hypothetical protein
MVYRLPQNTDKLLGTRCAQGWRSVEPWHKHASPHLQRRNPSAAATGGGNPDCKWHHERCHCSSTGALRGASSTLQRGRKARNFLRNLRCFKGTKRRCFSRLPRRLVGGRIKRAQGGSVKLARGELEGAREQGRGMWARPPTACATRLRRAFRSVCRAASCAVRCCVRCPSSVSLRRARHLCLCPSASLRPSCASRVTCLPVAPAPAYQLPTASSAYARSEPARSARG